MDDIPANSGKFLVGCADFMTEKAFRYVKHPGSIDAESKENPGTSPGDHINDATIPGYFMRIFYPTIEEAAEKYQRSKWIPTDTYSDGFTSFVHLPVWLFGKFTKFFLGSAQMHAYLDAPLLSPTHDSKQSESKRDRWPVVVFSHGLGGNRTCYSAFCADLASKGFFVAAVEHRDQSASASYCIDNNKEVIIPFRKLSKSDDEFQLRNSQVNQRAIESSMALTILEILNSDEPNPGVKVDNVISSQFDFSSLKGALDLKNVAVVGHSFGGCTALNTLAKDNRFKCGIVFDAWMFPLSEDVYGKVEQPVLFVNSESFHWKRNILQINQMIGNDTNKEMMTIRGTGHHSQCDIPSVVPNWLLMLLKMSASLDQHVAMHVQRRLMFSFLLQYLDVNYEASGNNADDESVTKHVMSGSNLELNEKVD